MSIDVRHTYNRTNAAGEEAALDRTVWPHIFMALFGAGWAVSFDLGVRIYGAEIVTALGLLLINWRPLLRQYPMLRSILLAYGLWVIGIGVSDLVNETATIDSLRHIATPVIGAASLVFVLATLARKPTAFLTFLAATAVTKGILGDAMYGDAFADRALSWESVQADTNYFKVRIEPFLTPALLLLACWFGRRRSVLPIILFFLVSIGYFAIDARSSGLVFFLSALVMAAIHLDLKPRTGQLVVGTVVAVALAYGGYIFYVDYTLKYSSEGHNGKQLQRLENPYNPVELLLQGRSEWLVMTEAIAERPAFGWGSWAEDKDLRFAYLRMDRAGVEDYGSLSGVAQRLYIPAHSLIGSAWVWSGLVGFLAIIWLLRTVWRMSLRLPLARSPIVPAVVFMTTLLLWHYMFSPPQHIRISFPAALAALLVLSQNVVNRYGKVR